MQFAVKYFTALIFLLQSAFLIAQKSGFNPGDLVNESIPVFDTVGKKAILRIPKNNNYILVYRYRWKSIGRGFDNADSLKLLENKIAAVLLGGMVENLKVICLSYDNNADYATWMQNVRKGKPLKPNDKYGIDYYNLNGNYEAEKKCQELFTKLSLFGPDGKILRYSSSIAKFDYHIVNDKINLKGKIVTDDNGVKEPLSNIMVHVESGKKGDTLGKARTDRYGDFEMKIPNNDTSYTIKANPEKDIKNIMLMTQEGKEISYLRKTFRTFEYKLLKADMLYLAEVKQDDDITLTFRKFESGKEKTLMVVEDINYDLDQYNINQESEVILDKVVDIMLESKDIKLEVISHTDSQGDDQTNFNLSQKRALSVVNYLTSKGISSSRIKALGKGESQIRNRCVNGADCSDKEHRYNRRTEFKFIR